MPTVKRFTVTYLEALAKSREKRIEISEAGGLRAVVGRNGTISLGGRYRRPDTKKAAHITFGCWPKISLAKARQMWATARLDIQNGIDPGHGRLGEKRTSGEMIIAAAKKYRQLEKAGVVPQAFLYRHYHYSGDLLYVGITLDPLARQHQHKRSNRWSICWIVIEPFITREEVLVAEETAIRNEFPRFNRTYNDRRHPLQELRRQMRKSLPPTLPHS